MVATLSVGIKEARTAQSPGQCYTSKEVGPRKGKIIFRETVKLKRKWSAYYIFFFFKVDSIPSMKTNVGLNSQP